MTSDQETVNDIASINLKDNGDDADDDADDDDDVDPDYDDDADYGDCLGHTPHLHHPNQYFY